MKRLILLFFVLFPLFCLSQTIQKGRVLEKDSNGKPLENVEIIVKDASPVMSGADGEFQLVFKDKSPGEMIFVESIRKIGYKLVNEHEVKNWIFSNVKDFNIILCKEGLIKESQKLFYNIGKSQYESEYNRRRLEIDSLKQTSQITEKEYNQRLKKIYNEQQQALEQLGYYSELYSHINVDDLSELQRKAYILSKQGKIEEAIQILKKEKESKELDVE